MRDRYRRRRSRSYSKERDRRRKPSPKRRRRRLSSSSLSSTDSEYLRSASWIVGRSRTRSPHPWLRQLGGETPPRRGNEREPDRELFWDGFQWVAKSNMLGTNIDQVLETHRRARRLGVSNLPMEYNITENDIKEFFTKKMIQFNLTDPGNQNSVLKIYIDEEQPNSATVEFSSQDEAARALRLDGIRMLGKSLKVARTEEIEGLGALGQVLGVNTHVISASDSVETSAKAAAAAVAAIQDIQGNRAADLAIEGQYSKPKNKVLKISDFVDKKGIEKLPEAEFKEIEGDMMNEFSKFGVVNYCRMVRPADAKLGAEPGCVLIEFTHHDDAENAKLNMFNKKYDGKDIKIIDVPDSVFQEELKINVSS